MDTKGINSAVIDLGKHEERNPRALTPHPRNAVLYGDELNEALLIDIREHGMREAIVITPDGIIISGHSRCKIAIALNYSLVSVIVVNLIDPIEIEAAMISANNTRQKTNYMRAREYQRLKPIEEARAKQRMLAGKKITPPSNSAEGPAQQGEAREIAATEVGLKPTVAEQGLKVVEAVDRAQGEELPKDAESMIEHLNKCFLKGYKRAKSLGYIKDKSSEKLQRVTTYIGVNLMWNPMTGCQGKCEFCEMRAYAIMNPGEFFNGPCSKAELNQQRLFPFAPRFHEGRLNAPQNTKPPRGEGKNIYVLTCWQGDLFSSGVDQEWIEQILKTVRESQKQHLPWQYLFLTKYPERLLTIDWPANAWVGVTADTQEHVAPAEEVFAEIRQRYPNLRTYIACEPLQEPLHFTSLTSFNWLFIGGLRYVDGYTGTKPPCDNIFTLMAQAYQDGCRVIIDPSLQPHWPSGSLGEEFDDDYTLRQALQNLSTVTWPSHPVA